MPESETGLEEAFHERLLEALAEVKLYTRAGLNATLRRIQTDGGLKVAKQLCRRKEGDDVLARLVNQPGQFFRAAERAGRIDLSVEAIVLEARWAPLFAQEELKAASERLSEEGYNLPVQQYALSQPTGIALIGQTFSQFALSAKATWIGNDCETTAARAVAVGKGLRPVVSYGVRRHLDACARCRALHTGLVDAYERFDREALEVWLDLLNNFEATLKLDDADLKRFFFNQPEDFQNTDDYEVALEMQIRQVRDLCAWRAARLGCHIGRFMTAFTSTFGAGSNSWLKWRQGEISSPVSNFIQEMKEDHFVLALAATNLLLVREWNDSKDDLLFLPSDGDLTSVPGILQVDDVSGLDDLDDWVEVLGPPPNNLNLMGVLYLAYQAALSELQTLKTGKTERPTDQTLVDHLVGIKALLESQQTALDEIRSAQEAEIAQLERMVAYMSSSDRIACEETLIQELRAVYGKLQPEVRCQLMAAEQIFRVRGFAAPGVAVSALAAAFEVEMRRSLMPGLLGYLKFKGIRKLFPPSDWRDANSEKALYRMDLKAESLSLGPMERLLRHPEPAVGEYFDLIGLNRSEVREALVAVLNYRNEATHVKRSIDIGTAEAVRNDWLRWRGRPGGIFAVLFRSE